MKYVQSLIVLLALAGLGVSIQALRVHRMSPNEAPPCAVSAHWDCGTVGRSRFSWFLPKTSDEMIAGESGPTHIPVPVIGIAAYAAIAILALLGRLWAVFELAQIGFFFALFLTGVEAYVLEMWCIYCVWSQSLITAILVASVVALLLRRRQRRRASVSAASPAQ